MDIQTMNKKIIEEFRANNGKVGGPFAGGNLLIITTRGAKTGLTRVNPLAYLADGDRIIIIASYAGAPSSPPWLASKSVPRISRRPPGLSTSPTAPSYTIRWRLPCPPSRTIRRRPRG